MSTHVRLNIVRALVAAALLLCGFLAVRGTIQRLHLFEDELTRNRHRWEDNRPRHYRYEIEVRGYSTMGSEGIVVCEVRDDKNVLITRKDKEKFYDASPWGELDTMDKVFEYISKLKSGENEEEVLEFDPAYHFPSLAHISPGCTDCDREIRVTEFAALQ